jgi:hypothetical protein
MLNILKYDEQRRIDTSTIATLVGLLSKVDSIKYCGNRIGYQFV